MMVVAALAAPLCACQAKPEGGSPAGSASAALPAPWEPIDKDFKGCEGG
jgi:hypothetical protein